MSHSYGKSLRKDEFNAAKLLSSWNEHINTLNEDETKDYNKMNKLAILNKITSPRGVETFRKGVDLKLPKKYEVKIHA